MTRPTESAGHFSFLRSGAIAVCTEDTGSVNEKMLPFCGRLFTQIWPPCRVTSSLQMYRPEAQPLAARLRLPGYLIEAFEDSLPDLRADAAPRIGHFENQEPGLVRHQPSPDGDVTAFGGELDGVVDQDINICWSRVWSAYAAGRSAGRS